MDNKKLLGKRIKEIRKSQGYTQDRLSELVDIDITTLSGIESGRNFPSLITLEKIAKTLNVALTTLFDFYHFESITDMKQSIIDNIDLLSVDDIKFVYKLLNKKYIEQIV